MVRTSWLAAVAVVSLVACGGGGSTGDGLALRWAAHLHVARAQITLWHLGSDADGNVYALYQQVGPPEQGESVHLQKRDPAGTLLWDRTWSWPAEARPTGVAVTPLGNVLLGLAGAAPLRFGEVTVPIDGTHPFALVKVGPDGFVDWEQPLDRAAMPLATDAEGSTLAVDRAGMTDYRAPARGVFKVRWDGSTLWSAPFVAPGFGAQVAGDGAGGMYTLAADAYGATTGLLSRFDAAGATTWSNPLEGFYNGWLAPLPGGGALVYGGVSASSRYAGVALGAGDAYAVFAVGPDGARRWTREVLGGPMAMGPGGDLLLGRPRPVKGTFVVDLQALDARGAEAWHGTLAALPDLAAVDGRGRVVLGVSGRDGPFDVGGVRVEPFDAQSPVILGVGPARAAGP